MQYKEGICSQCPKDDNVKIIVNRTKMLCQYHNTLRLNKNKKPKEFYKYKRKPTGEMGLFLAIWQVRPHICTNCKAFLGDEPIPAFFAHIKSKGAYPELRLQPKNIMLLCFECHREYDQGTKERYERRKVI